MSQNDKNKQDPATNENKEIDKNVPKKDKKDQKEEELVRHISNFHILLTCYLEWRRSVIKGEIGIAIGKT